MDRQRFNQIAKLVADYQKAGDELYNAILVLLEKMRKISVKHGIAKKISAKERKQFSYFSFSDGNLSDAIEGKTVWTIYLEDIAYIYGDAVEELNSSTGIPAQWLWEDGWEEKFIRDYVEPEVRRKKAFAAEAEDEEYETYKRLKKKFEKKS